MACGIGEASNAAARERGVTKDIASGEGVEEIVEQHLANGDKPAAIGALLTWARTLRDSGKPIDAAAAEERARAIDPLDARHTPVSKRASGLASSKHALTPAKVTAPPAPKAPAAPKVAGSAAPIAPIAKVSAPEPTASVPTSPPPGGSPTAPPAAVTAPPAAITSPPAAMTSPPAAVTSPPAAVTSPPAAATAPPPAAAATPSPPAPAGPEIFDFGTNPPPPLDAAKSKEITRTLRSAVSEAPLGLAGLAASVATPPPPPMPAPPPDTLFEAEPRSDDMFEEDLSDQTSIMGLEERRALQKATRAGDAALLKAAAEKIAADRDAADAASKNLDKKATKEDFERPTVPPPPSLPDGAEVSNAATAAPKKASDPLDAPGGAPVLEVGEEHDAEDLDDALSPRTAKVAAAMTKPAAQGELTPAAPAKIADRNFVFFMIAAIVLLAIIAAVTLR
jgi:hypothetical protein